ncbi:MAG: hypothetical protein LC676_19950 [Loktanella sp.]|nr:hypothetical protein [Loktanella sp.]
MASENSLKVIEIGLAELSDRWPKTQSYVELFSDLEHESERGAILLTGAALDDALKDLLKIRLIQSKSTEELFTGTAPLATFSARIDLSFSAGVISKSEHILLHKLRKIRNECAHVKTIRFHEAPLKDKCLALELPYGDVCGSEHPAKHYVIIAQMLVLLLLWRSGKENLTLSDEPTHHPNRTKESVVERFSFPVKIPDFLSRG